MSALAEMQRQFLAGLMGEEAGPMAVYRRSVRASQHDALATTYPVVRRLVGDAFFREMARAYAARSPSRSGDLHLFGNALAGFIAQYRHARDLAYLPDVARLEWACHESLHAADAGPFDAAGLAGVPPERQGAIRLRLHPSVRLVESAHPIVALWQANQPDRDGTPDRVAGADRAFVWREGATVRMRSLEAVEWEFVRALAKAAALEQAVAAMGERDAGRVLEPLLARLARDGVIAGFDEGGA